MNNLTRRMKNLYGRNTLLFAYEGILIALINNLINNNNYLFATRLGASDFELSLVVSLPQLISMVVLIPGGILSDRMTNKRRMVILSLLCLSFGYALMGFVPVLGTYRLIAFLALLALSFAPLTLYNTTWQAYFSDVVPVDERNRTFTLRTKGGFLVAIIVPLATGALLANASANNDKIRLHQSFFWIACLLLVIQVFVLKKVTGGNVPSQKGLSFKELKEATVQLIHNREFMGFVGVSIFFYMTWQSDWTLFYLGQVNYLKLNEAWLSYIVVGGAIMQFVTAGFWSKMNERFGIRLGMVFGTLGLAVFPIAMIIGTSLPLTIGPTVFLVLCIVANFSIAAVMLNLYQCMLQVIPQINKTLSISIYTVLVALSNAVMPVVGVKVYTAFGSDLKALHITFILVFIFRLVAAGLWVMRWKRT